MPQQSAGDVLKEMENQVVLIVHLQTEEFLKLHIDKLPTHVLIYYPIRQMDRDGHTFFLQTIALAPNSLQSYAEETEAMSLYPHMVIQWNIKKYDPSLNV